MKKLVRSELEENPAKRQRIVEDTMARFPGTTREQVLKIMEDERKNAEVWVNDKYQVNVRRLEMKIEGCCLVWLSIKRTDKMPCHDWRELQEIKNQLVGPECEGIELYPAESRVVDTANQYHLYVIDDPQFRWPFGFNERLVDYEGSRDSKQRPKEGR